MADAKTPQNVSRRASQLATVKLEKIRVNEQARKYFDLTDLRALGENIREHGLLNPLLVKRACDLFDLIAGERRFRAMSLVGITECPALVVSHDLDTAETEVVQWIENAHRSDLLPAEKAKALLSIKEKMQFNNKQLAEHLHFTEASLVGRYLSLFDCIPSVQEAAMAGRLGVSGWYNVSLLAADQQQGLLEMYLAGLPRDQIASLSRQKRAAATVNGTAAKEKVTRVRCELPSGVQIVVSGDGITFDQLIDSLLQAAKSAKSARDQNVDPKTWAAMMRDQARKQAKGVPQ